MADTTGGPAFPYTDSASPIDHPGMNLRDYFAAKAMQAAIAHGESQGTKLSQIAWASYKMADAMLKAREAGNG